MGVGGSVATMVGEFVSAWSERIADHGKSIASVMKAIRAGFTGVMLDASHEPLQQNIAMTAAVTALGLYEAISPHDFRHYRATQLLNDGARLEDVQAILGHAHIGTTRDVYARTDRRTLREVYDTFTRSPREALADLEEQQRHER